MGSEVHAVQFVRPVVIQQHIVSGDGVERKGTQAYIGVPQLFAGSPVKHPEVPHGAGMDYIIRGNGPTPGQLLHAFVTAQFFSLFVKSEPFSHTYQAITF